MNEGHKVMAKLEGKHTRFVYKSTWKTSLKNIEWRNFKFFSYVLVVHISTTAAILLFFWFLSYMDITKKCIQHMTTFSLASYNRRAKLPILIQLSYHMIFYFLFEHSIQFFQELQWYLSFVSLDPQKKIKPNVFQ